MRVKRPGDDPQAEAAIFLLEIEGFLNEDVQRRFAMRVAPKTENSHLFVDDPILAALGISKLLATFIAEAYLAAKRSSR